MSQGERVPQLSVIVVAFNGLDLLERCLESLEAQRGREGVELLVVLAAEMVESAEAARLQQRFSRTHWIASTQGCNVPQMRGLGMEKARGEILALLEDDCVPGPTWCQEVLQAHAGSWAAVGGAIEPGDYARASDWAAYFCEYYRFLPPLPKGDGRYLPGTNVSYKRSSLERVLAAQHAGLDPGGIAGPGFYEAFVHQELRRLGESLGIAPKLSVRHGNSRPPARVLEAQFHHGRGFAGMRVEGQAAGRRAPFLGLALALPFLQVARIGARVIAGRRYLGRLATALPWIVAYTASWSAGEFAGYLFGPGDSPNRWR